MASTHFSVASLSVFNENFSVWSKKMEAYLEAYVEIAVEKAFVSRQRNENAASTTGRQLAERKTPKFGRCKSEGEKKRYGPCCHCKRDGHMANFCWYRPNVKCRHCGEFGHVQRVCKRRRNEVQPRAQAQEAVEDKQKVEFSFAANCFPKCKSKGIWILDSGSSNHMCFEETLFCNLDKSKSVKVRLANGTYVDTCGRGDVLVNTPRGTKLISNVLFAPSLSVNLLSVGQMMERNYFLNFSNRTCTIFDQNGCLLFEVPTRDKIFVLEFENDDLEASVGLKKPELSSEKLGHVDNDLCEQKNASNTVETGETSKCQDERVEKLEALLEEGKTKLKWKSDELEKAKKLMNVVDCQSNGGAANGKEKVSKAVCNANNPSVNFAMQVKQNVKLYGEVAAMKAPEVKEVSSDCVRGTSMQIVEDVAVEKRHEASTSNGKMMWRVAGHKPAAKTELSAKQKLSSSVCLKPG